MKKLQKEGNTSKQKTCKHCVFNAKTKRTKGPQKTTTKCCSYAIRTVKPAANVKTSPACKKQEVKDKRNQQK